MFPLIVEPQELANHLNEVVLLDLSSEETYRQVHLPGATHIHPTHLIRGEKPAVGKLPTLDQLEDLFSHVGYQPDQHIVVYDDEGGGWAGRMIWTLDVIGHKSYSYLNGGIHAWLADQLPVTQDIPHVLPTDPDIQIDESFIASKQQILVSLKDQSLTVWDARGPDEFVGQKVVTARGGRIPGAINFEWTWGMDPDKALRIREDIKDRLEAAGIDGSKPIVTHCQTHHRSGFTYLLGKSLGFEIRAYDGSWSEWGNDPDTPIETG
jgi:thiosulfate/3-mercaptopyruvate sulfurtransferase